MKRYIFNGHLTPTPPGMLPLQMSGEVFLATDVTHELLTLAAQLVRGELLPDIDPDGSWYVSTPRSERRRIIKALEDCHERHKLLGLALKDSLDGKSVPKKSTAPSYAGEQKPCS